MTLDEAAEKVYLALAVLPTVAQVAPCPALACVRVETRLRGRPSQVRQWLVSVAEVEAMEGGAIVQEYHLAWYHRGGRQADGRHWETPGGTIHARESGAHG